MTRAQELDAIEVYIRANGKTGKPIVQRPKNRYGRYAFSVSERLATESKNAKVRAARDKRRRESIPPRNAEF